MSSVSFSPDGRYLASCGLDVTINLKLDKTIKLWDVSDCFLIRTLKGDTNDVFSVSFSPDGKYLASGSYDKTIKLWLKFDIELENINKFFKGLGEIDKLLDEELPYSEIVHILKQLVKDKDIPSRYQKLILNSRHNEGGLKEYPSYKETVISTAKNIGESKLLEGKYEFIREIGRGGMGIVYEAINKEVGKKVAIKKMREELAINIREKKRFLDEARRVAELHHPNIVDIYDMFEEGGNVHLVFEYIDGDTVDNILSKKERYSLEEAKNIIIPVCSALEYAHNKRIIHRDIKPSNIMVTKERYVKVMDFGIARKAKDTITRLSGRDTSGTLAYMSPEQELGSFDIRSDIYSLGVTFYEMVTGELPFRGPNFLEQKRGMIYRPATELVPEIPKKIDEIISKCLKSDKEERYNSVKELVKELESCKF